VPRPAEVPFLVQSQLDNGGYFFQAIARLRPGVSLEQARQAMDVVAAGYRAEHPANVDAPSQIEVVPLLDDAVGAQRQSYLLLFGAVGCVLLIACANIANIMLARANARRHELGLRIALGASRWRIARQLLTESMLLSVLGAALGLVFAAWGSALLVAQLTTFRENVFLDISLDWRVMAFTAGVAITTALLFGMVPAFRAGRVEPNDALKEQSRTVSGERHRMLGQPLVVVQVALSLVLVVAAGLFLRSFAALAMQKVGFDREALLVVNLDVQTSGVESAERPHMLEHNEQFAKVLSQYHVRTFVKPGVTGLAQVRGFRGEAHAPEDIRKRVECDVEYIERWSLLLDLFIVLKTAWQVLRPPKSAY